MAAAALLLCASVGGLTGQEPAALSRADVALYAGGAWTRPWLEAGDGSTFGIGFNPIFGGFAQYWWTARFGTRLHLAYMPSDLPEMDPPGALTIPDARMHNWFYDLSLAFRPLATSARRPFSGFYLFVGAGGFTANPEGGQAGECVPPYDFGDACLPYDWREATVGQVTVGAGLPFFPVSRNVSLFSEVAVHGYSSPFHRGPEWTGLPVCPNPACATEDRLGLTTRLVGGVLFALGAPRPAPLVPPPPPTPPAPPPPPEERPITICVVVDGLPRYVEAFVRPELSDTVIVTEQGIRRPLRAVYPTPPPTATGRTWFIRDESIFLNGREYVRFGVPRELTTERLQRIGAYQGVPLFTVVDDVPPTGEAATLYVPVDDGCIFQPYQHRERVRRVRG